MKIFLRIVTMLATIAGIVFLVNLYRQRKLKKEQFYI